jgi:glucose-1-phosphate thymidylyltransferase
MSFKKGIILAGGLGTRLHPATKIISKQLLPVYDSPMIYYSLSILLKLKVKKINIISDPKNIFSFRKLLGSGSNLGVKFYYTIQKKPKGIAQALILSKKFIKKDKCILVLGDNIFYGGNFNNCIFDANKDNLSSIFVKRVKNPNKYGVLLEKKNRQKIIIEKPKKKISNLAVTGLYFYNNSVINYLKNLKFSKRGELEITDLNNLLLKDNILKIKKLNNSSKWFDAGTHVNLLQASNDIFNLGKKKRDKIFNFKKIK